MQMRQYRYRVTLEQLTDSHGVPTDRKPLQFEVGNHDDIISVVTWIRSRGDFSSQAEAAAFGVGLKLFGGAIRSEEHTSELQSLMRNSYAVFCLKKKKQQNTTSEKLRRIQQEIIKQ